MSNGPLDWRIAIVDKQGRPVPEFQLKWNELRSSSLNAVLPGYASGFELSTAGASSTFSVKAGAVAASDSTGIMVLDSTFTKTTAAWAAGTAAGSLDTGVIANNTWYYVFAIGQLFGQNADILISTTLTPTLPYGYTMYRRIGAMKTDGAAHWIKFIQINRYILLDNAISNAAGTVPPVVPTLQAVTTPPGIITLALLRIAANNGGAALNELLFTSPNISGNTANVPGANAQMFVPAGSSGVGQEVQIWTNTSSQILVSAINNFGGYFLLTTGWFDPL